MHETRPGFSMFSPLSPGEERWGSAWEKTKGTGRANVIPPLEALRARGSWLWGACGRRKFTHR